MERTTWALGSVTEVGPGVTRRTHAHGVLGLALVVAGLLATVGGVVATATDAASSGPAAVESAEVPSTPTGSLGDLVFEDRDDDARRDPAEPGVGGVTVNLLDRAGQRALTSTGAPVPPQVTDAAGRYEFTGLDPGTYRVGFADLPAGARLTGPGGDADVDDDSDPDPATGTTPPLDLSVGERDLTVDAGVFVPAPGVAIETRVQGLDADVAPGPSVAEGAEVGFDYLVTNTGNERLVDLVVADDQAIAVDCAQTTVAIGQTIACSGASTATAGVHRNLGTVVATGADSALEVSAEDPAHHTGAAAGLVVDKQVEGADADVAADALRVPAGSPVTYTFTVTNVAAETAVDVWLEDVGAWAVPCPADEVAPGEAMVCEPRTLPAPVGLGTNVVVARGRSGDSSTPLVATDAANVFGLDPGLVVFKEAYDPARRTYLDADADAGSPGSNDGAAAVLEPGAAARYRLQLTNTGNVDLPGASVVDQGCDAAPEVVLGDHGSSGTLEVGEAWTLRCERAGVTEPYTNSAEATANGVTAGERARVTVSAAEVADLALAKTLLPRSGDAVEWALTVLNLGPGPADGPVSVVDDLPAGLAFTGAAGAGWTCTATGQVVRCDGPGLAEGASSRVVLTTRLAPGTTGTLRNAARLDGADGNGANDASSAVLSVTTTTSTSAPPTTAPPTSAPTTTAPPTTLLPPGPPGAGPRNDANGGHGGPSTPGGHIPSTGADVLGLWITGLSLVALGLLLVWSGRRRRKVDTTAEAGRP